MLPKKIKLQLQKIVHNIDIKDLEFSVPPKKEMGDICFSCFNIAKKEAKNPVEVAHEIVEHIRNDSDISLSIIQEVKAFGPYVNFFLNTSELAKIVLEDELEIENIAHVKKVLIEYPSQNTHKEFHIGHFRNVCIGNTIVQLYRACGYDMIPMNYVNDFGRHVVKVLWYIQKFDKHPDDNKQKWLGEIYSEASNYIKEHEDEVISELDELQYKLENHDVEVTKLFEETREWSILGFKKLMDELKVEHDSIMYESDVKERGQEIVDELLDKHIAEVGEGGAIIVNLEKYNLDIALLRKSTGAGVYMTSDLGLTEKKFSQYNIEESINITGTEQNHYFKQLYKVLELNGFENKMTHVGYGLVNLPSGKMSSRAGNIILYEDLRDKIFEYLKKETVERHKDWNEEKINNMVHILTQAVLKFTMQKHESRKVITFDMKEAVSFEGYSAPYILYVVARINSLFRKSKKSKVEIQKLKINFDLIKETEEKQILMFMMQYPDIVAKAKEQYNPSTIARYCFELAKAYNDFYHKHSILQAESEYIMEARLGLSLKLHDMLVRALGLLTIDVVDEM